MTPRHIKPSAVDATERIRADIATVTSFFPCTRDELRWVIKMSPFGRNILYCEEAWRCYKPNCDIHCVKWKWNAIKSRAKRLPFSFRKMGVWLVFGVASDKFRGLFKSLSNLIINNWGLYRMKTRTLGGECWCLPGPWGWCERRARGMNSGASGLST